MVAAHREVGEYASKIQILSQKLLNEQSHSTHASSNGITIQALAKLTDSAAEEVSTHLQGLKVQGSRSWFRTLMQAVKQQRREPITTKLQKLDRLDRSLQLYLTADTRSGESTIEDCWFPGTDARD